MPKILLVDDDARIRSIVREYAQTEEWSFAEAENGADALKLLEPGDVSLIVLDVMMPVMDGWTALRHIRKTSQAPVIMLTARNEEYDRLLGFELGVDDYVAKPFSPRELVARIKVHLKRAAAPAHEAQKLSFDGLVLDLDAHRVTVDGEPATLTPKEYDLLVFFATRPDKAFTRDQLLNHVWGYDYYGDGRTVDTHVRSLRDKLGPYRRMIATVWGTGYRFEPGGAK